MRRWATPSRKNKKKEGVRSRILRILPTSRFAGQGLEPNSTKEERPSSPKWWEKKTPAPRGADRQYHGHLFDSSRNVVVGQQHAGQMPKARQHTIEMLRRVCTNSPGAPHHP